MLSGKDIEYMNYTLGDIGVIELLLAYRYKYDDYLFFDDSIAMAVSGAGRVNEEVIYTYVALDKTIERCNFNEQQLKILRMIGEGYTQSEIAFETGTQQSGISGRLKTMYKRIYKENEWLWRKSVYQDKLGLRNKKCSKCKEELPATVEFYSDYNRSKDGFHSICKMCRL